MTTLRSCSFERHLFYLSFSLQIKESRKKFNVIRLYHTNTSEAKLCSSKKQLKSLFLLLTPTQVKTAESAQVKAVNLSKIPSQLGMLDSLFTSTG